MSTIGRKRVLTLRTCCCSLFTKEKKSNVGNGTKTPFGRFSGGNLWHPPTMIRPPPPLHPCEDRRMNFFFCFFSKLCTKKSYARNFGLEAVRSVSYVLTDKVLLLDKERYEPPKKKIKQFKNCNSGLVRFFAYAVPVAQPAKTPPPTHNTIAVKADACNIYSWRRS